MEIRRLRASDYDALLYVLNTSFAAVRSRPVDFLRGQPKMWVRDDLYMGRHLGLFEDGMLVSVVGIYPLDLRVGDVTLRFATTGNVATLPEYAGRGYFTRLFSLAMEEAEKEGYDALRLGGQKQRYERFGFEDLGVIYSAQISGKNRAAVAEGRYAGITFLPLREDDLLSLRYIRALTAKAPCFVERYESEGERDMYRVLHSKYSEAYTVMRDGAPIGYLSASDGGACVTELRTEREEDFLSAILAWQKNTGVTVTLTLAPWMKAELRDVSSVAEIVTANTPSKFKFLHIERVADAFLKLKHALSPLPHGVFRPEIKDYGVLKLAVDGEGARCERVENEAADVSLDIKTAAKVLFGALPASAFACIPGVAQAFLPLPLSWNFLDVV